jgi:hypothetical protein
MFEYYDTGKQMFGTDVLDAGREASVSNRQIGQTRLQEGITMREEMRSYDRQSRTMSQRAYSRQNTARTTSRAKARAKAQRENSSVWIPFVCFIAAVFVIALFVNFLLPQSIHAKANPVETTQKYYTSIRIEDGDTLWNIASRNMTDDYTDITAYMDEVCSINHITRDEIHAGEYLTIPYYAAEPESGEM